MISYSETDQFCRLVLDSRSPGHPAHPVLPVQALITQILSSETLKGVLILTASGNLTDESVFVQPPELTAAFYQHLSRACVPVVAVINGVTPCLEQALCQACLFTAESETAARVLLTSLCGNRSPHQIRSIMTSIHNASELSLADALREESRLFVELAVQGVHTA